MSMFSTHMRLRPLLFKVNRPLTFQEKNDQLHQDKPSLSVPWCFLSVIRMNSTFLECVDQYHERRGIGVAASLLGLLVFGYLVMVVNTTDYQLFHDTRHLVTMFDWITDNLMVGIPLLLIFWSFTLECFRLTHYPIIFNRKTKMVYAHRSDGTIMSEHWEKIFFTPIRRPDYNWEILGHIMDKDGVTVRDTFVLPLWTSRDDDGPNPCMYSLWEFIRRYMEEGPEKLAYQVEITINVSGKKETYMDGLIRLVASLKDSPIFMIGLMPLILLGSIGRLIVKLTCKIPVWPEEILKTCEFSSDDPYIRDEYHLSPPGSATVPRWGHYEPENNPTTQHHYYSED